VYQNLYPSLLGDGIAYAGSMIGLLHFVLAILVSPFRSKSRLEAENAVLRHQLIVLRRKVKGRAQITNNDAGSLFSCTDGSRQPWRYSQSFVPRPWCIGTGLAFVVIGVGNHGDGEGGRRSRRNCAR
jgi:hypothetical protein